MKNLVEFINEAKSTPLDEKEIEAFAEWFEEHINGFEAFSDKGVYSVYFPSRDELKKLHTRVNMSTIPHLTISKPPRLKGGFGIMVYKGGNWAASEFPNPSRAFKNDGSPKYATVEEVLAILDKNLINGNWGKRLGADIK